MGTYTDGIGGGTDWGGGVTTDYPDDVVGGDGGGGSSGWGTGGVDNFDLSDLSVLDPIGEFDVGDTSMGDQYTDLGSYDGYDETGWGGYDSGGDFTDNTDGNSGSGWGSEESGSGSGSDYGGTDDTGGGYGGDTPDDGGDGESSMETGQYAMQTWVMPTLENMFNGQYAENLPNFQDYMQQSGIGSMSDYMSGVTLPNVAGYETPDMLSYYDKFINDPNASAAWNQAATEGENQLLERLGQYGGSASGGFSGQQAAGLGRYWSDQVLDRWNAATPYAQTQFGADLGSNIYDARQTNMLNYQDWTNRYTAGTTDYGNMYSQVGADFGIQMDAYNKPYDFSSIALQNYMGQSATPPGEGGSNWAGLIGGVAGGALGAYFGGPMGAAAGYQVGSNAGTYFGW